MEKKIVLIVAAHADDESLGCGGTIARHLDEGDEVHAVFMTDGISSRQNQTDDEMKHRISAASNAHRILGLNHIRYLDFPDNCMDTLPLLTIVQALEDVIKSISPHVIYTHHFGDLNIDHRITHKAVMTACRPQPGASVRDIFTFEVLSSTEWATPSLDPFLPNVFIDISDYLDIKIKALNAYQTEMRSAPNSRNIEHSVSLAHHRGNSVGVSAAEAFMLIRHIR